MGGRIDWNGKVSFDGKREYRKVVGLCALKGVLFVTNTFADKAYTHKKTMENDTIVMHHIVYYMYAIIMLIDRVAFIFLQNLLRLSIF